MNITNFITRKFRKGTGSSSIIYVPRHNYSEIQKRYIDLIDIIGDKSIDFQQMVARLISMTGTRPEFQQLDFGSDNDAYKVLTFAESSINALIIQVEDTIQLEFRCREDIIEFDELYQELTNLKLTEDQQATLLEFERIHTEKYLALATTSHKKDIVQGHNDTKKILESQHDTQEGKIQQEKDHLELAKLQSKHFKPVAQNQQKNHFKRKSAEYPKLTKDYMKQLQETLDSTKNIQNGAGTFSFMQKNETESRENNNNHESQEK